MIVVHTLIHCAVLSAVTAPAVLVVSMEGVAGCMDPALLQWFSYTPRKHVRTLSTADICAAAVDVPLAQATSPLQTGGSHSEPPSNRHTRPSATQQQTHTHLSATQQQTHLSSFSQYSQSQFLQQFNTDEDFQSIQNFESIGICFDFHLIILE